MNLNIDIYSIQKIKTGKNYAIIGFFVILILNSCVDKFGPEIYPIKEIIESDQRNIENLECVIIDFGRKKLGTLDKELLKKMATSLTIKDDLNWCIDCKINETISVDIDSTISHDFEYKVDCHPERFDKIRIRIMNTKTEKIEQITYQYCEKNQSNIKSFLKKMNKVVEHRIESNDYQEYVYHIDSITVTNNLWLKNTVQHYNHKKTKRVKRIRFLEIKK